MPTSPPRNSYDEVPYDSNPFAQTHPSRLAVVATLFGLSPPPAERCRVLELGCASGGNLLPMAESLPESEFVGVDLSARQIEGGQRLARAAGLANVTLRHASIADVGDSYGTFDYVICHGVFSWVPRDVQEKVFEVCARRLAPNGVAYVSYNTYPGWHMRGMVRDMLRYHALQFDTPGQRVAQARALLEFLAQSAKQDAGAYGTLLRTELELLRNQSDRYLYHEQLEEVNEPLYFHQFAARAGARGLRYLGEARVSTMMTGNFGPDVQKALAELASDPIRTEQYLDFVRNRTFRETLLVREGQSPDWTIAPERLAGLHVAMLAKAVGAPVDPASPAPARFQSASGMAVATTQPLSKAAMLLLAEASPGTLPFAELLSGAAAKLGRAPTREDATSLALGLLSAFVSSDVIELHAAPVRFARAPGERPAALAHARAAAAEGQAVVANRRHEAVRPDDFARQLLPLLDGTRDRAALVEALAAKARAGELSVQKSGRPVTDPAELRAALAGLLGPALESLARDALLTA
jgi:methyltransferase-like protein/SAM-dependent methyltransferase